MQFEERTIDFVNDHDRLDALCQSLTKYSLSLYTDTFDAVYNYESTICDTECGSDFGREIDVARGINKID